MKNHYNAFEKAIRKIYLTFTHLFKKYPVLNLIFNVIFLLFMVSGVLGTKNPNKHLVMISFYTWTVIILVGDIIDNLSLILVKVPKQQGSFQKFFENKYKVMRALGNLLSVGVFFLAIYMLTIHDIQPLMRVAGILIALEVVNKVVKLNVHRYEQMMGWRDDDRTEHEYNIDDIEDKVDEKNGAVFLRIPLIFSILGFGYSLWLSNTKVSSIRASVLMASIFYIISYVLWLSDRTKVAEIEANVTETKVKLKWAYVAISLLCFLIAVGLLVLMFFVPAGAVIKAVSICEFLLLTIAFINLAIAISISLNQYRLNNKTTKTNSKKRK